MPKEPTQYVTISIPVAIANEIDQLIEESGYWPSRSAFVREACLEKLFKERQRLEELKQFEQRYQ